MKKTFIACLIFISASLSAAAQHFSVGVRSGVSAWGQRAEGDGFKLEATPGQHLSWDQQVFLRCETKGRWAFEGSLAHSVLSRSTTTFIIDDFPPHTSFDLTTKWRADHFELSLSAQYDITCAHLKACPLMRRFHSYAGVTVTPMLTRLRESYETNSPLIDLAGPSASERFDVWTGLSHTMLFDATSRMTLSAVFEGSVAPAQLFLDNEVSRHDRPSARLGFRLGAAYRL